MSFRISSTGELSPELAQRIERAAKKQWGANRPMVTKELIENAASIGNASGHLRDRVSLATVHDICAGDREVSWLERSSANMEPQVALWRSLIPIYGRWESGGECVWELTGVVPGRRFRIDIAMPRYKLAIEMDGFKYHRSKDAYQSDRKRNRLIVAEGWSVISCFTGEVFDDIDQILCDIGNAVNRRNRVEAEIRKISDFSWRFECFS